MRNNKKCPFLEEVVVRYCKAYPIKKMIPANVLLREDPCIGCPEKCSTYQEIAQAKPTIKHKTMKEKELTMAQAKQDKQCIWMKAGVVAYRICTSNYDCKNCEFDQSLTDQGSSYGDSSMIKQAIEKLRALPADKRKCRYMLTGDISYKLCPNNYECWHCSVDQMVQDIIDTNPLLAKKRAKKAETLEKVRGFSLHPSVYYLPNHIWVKIDKDNEIKVGLDEFATKLLGEITKVLPISKGELLSNITVEHRNRLFKVPIQPLGKVVKTNDEILAKPGIITEDPYNKGWLFTVESADILDNLKDAHKGADAKKWLEKEVDALGEMVQEECGISIADGGEFVSDLRNRIAESLSEKILKRFLKVEA